MAPSWPTITRMKSAGSIIRATLILFAILAGALGILRVVDVIAREDFLEWLWRTGAAVAIVGAVGLAIHAMKGGDN